MVAGQGSLLRYSASKKGKVAGVKIEPDMLPAATTDTSSQQIDLTRWVKKTGKDRGEGGEGADALVRPKVEGGDDKQPSEAAKPGAGMWWRCPRCSYAVPLSLGTSARASRKQRHIRSHGGRSKTAIESNFMSRARMLRAVYSGQLLRTPGGLTKEDLQPNSRGRIVPKKRSAHSSKIFTETGLAKNWRKWCRAHKKVRQGEGITAFLKVRKTGGTEEQQRLYVKVVENWADGTLDEDGQSPQKTKSEATISPNQKRITDLFGSASTSSGSSK